MATILKFLLVLVVIIFGVLFCAENSDHVPVGLVLGSPMQIRLIWLLVVAVSIGFVAAYLLSLLKEIKFRREIRRLSLLNRATMARLSGETRDQVVREPR